MKHLKKIKQVVGSSVEHLCWFDDFDSKESECVRRNVAPIIVTCEAIQSDLNCIYKNPRTRECMYILSKEDYANVPVELIRDLRSLR